MKQFTDTTGKPWQIAVTLGSAMQVKAVLGIDLLQPEQGDPPLISRLATDEYLLGAVICELIARQMEAAGITAKEVQDRFDGPTLLAANEAFWEELRDFFQTRGRTDRASAVQKQSGLIKTAVDLATRRIDEMNPTIPGT